MPESSRFYLRVRILVKDGKMAEFVNLMIMLLPTFAGYGWHLVYAGYTVTGRPTTVEHLWSIPSANSVLDLMEELSEDPLYNDLLAVTSEQVQEILTLMPYGPVPPVAGAT